MGQEMQILPEHMLSLSVFMEVHVLRAHVLLINIIVVLLLFTLSRTSVISNITSDLATMTSDLVTMTSDLVTMTSDLVTMWFIYAHDT